MLINPVWLVVWIALVLCGQAQADPSGNSIPISVSGLDDERLIRNINAHIEQLRVPRLPFQFPRYEEQIRLKTRQALQPFGYYQPIIDINITTHESSIDSAAITIQLGPATIIKSSHFSLSGAGATDPTFSDITLPNALTKGAVFEHATYEAFKRDVRRIALSFGYFDFQWLQSQAEVSLSTSQVDIELQAQPGMRYRFGELEISNETHSEDIIRQLAPFETNDEYDAALLADFGQSLSISKYFSQALARPLLEEAVDNVIPIEVLVTDKDRDIFDIGGGYSSDIGARARFKWQRPWVNQRGHMLESELFVSAPERWIAADYKIPMGDTEFNYANISLGAQTKDENDTESEKWTLSVQRHWGNKDDSWRQTAFFRAEQETFIQGALAEQTTRLFVPGYSISSLNSDANLIIQKGEKHLFTVEVAAKKALSDINMIRLIGQTKWIRSYGQHRLTARAEIGVIATDDFDALPSSLRFFTGGDQSIRGFSYENISPVDEQQKLTGGQYLAVGSIEYSYPLNASWRLATFFDAGTATNDFEEGLSTGIGGGLIWQTLIGPVRFYVAHGKNEFGSQNHFHFSMGPAL